MGRPAILLHGFPDDAARLGRGRTGPGRGGDARAWCPICAAMVRRGIRDAATPRSGQQAALGADLLALMDAMGDRRRRCWRAMTGAGARPASSPRCGPSGCAAWSPPMATTSRTSPDRSARRRAEQEARYWYQWYLHTERGVAALEADRRGLLPGCCGGCGRPTGASPRPNSPVRPRASTIPTSWRRVVQSYRHRHRAAPGDPALQGIEDLLAARPPIAVPSVVLHGAEDGVDPPANSEGCARWFAGPFRRAVVQGAGHFCRGRRHNPGWKRPSAPPR